MLRRQISSLQKSTITPANPNGESPGDLIPERIRFRQVYSALDLHRPQRYRQYSRYSKIQQQRRYRRIHCVRPSAQHRRHM